MCDCIKKLKKKLDENCKTQTFRKPYEKVEIEQAFVMDGNKMKLRTYTKAIVTLTGQKKKIEHNILHSHCPFCGEKINEETAA